jgi:hypothetical protein
VEQSNQEMILRLHRILEPPSSPVQRRGTGTCTGGSRAARQHQQQQEEEYLQRREYRARVLREGREARQQEVVAREQQHRRHVQAVTSLVPGPIQLQRVGR